jgi:hypothetical protein
MTQDALASMAAQIMAQFAEGTGLSSANAPRRYLWTDAFAVCNLLGLYVQTGEERYKNLALRLVDQVHHVLGRHREDDPRSGWISGLGEDEGEQHPTQGGLRIGKRLNERRPGDRYDEHLEWDRDGQYYHYLTKWMHALNRASRVTGDGSYHLWAVELAKVAHAGFTYRPPSGGPKRMYWKMSIDLSYPLVLSMGQHDPLDGLITYRELQAAVSQGSERVARPALSPEISEMAGMCEGRVWATDDALGIGGLLSDAYRVAQLMVAGDSAQSGLLETLLDSSLQSLKAYTRRNALQLPVTHRLAFRELGLSIGLHAVQRLRALTEEQPAVFHGRPVPDSRIDALLKYVPMAGEIEGFWLERAHQETGNWSAHRDINMVMLATSLGAEGYLKI